jgi:hypothetical protein
VNKGIFAMNYNTNIHLDEWVDFDNQVHKFYEPLYPGGNAYNPFEDVSEPAKKEINSAAEEKSPEPEMATTDSR